jgi:phosphoesterase RecJ-like protein
MKLNKIESEIVKKIESYNDISLFFHSHPDFDALCSCFAIKEFINSKYPKKRIYIARFNSLDQEITQGFFPKQKNKPHNFLRNSLGIICDTANSERVAAQEYKNCKELIRFDHHPYTEKFANIEYVDDKSSACCELIAIFLIN